MTQKTRKWIQWTFCLIIFIRVRILIMIFLEMSGACVACVNDRGDCFKSLVGYPERTFGFHSPCFSLGWTAIHVKTPYHAPQPVHVSIHISSINPFVMQLLMHTTRYWTLCCSSCMMANSISESFVSSIKNILLCTASPKSRIDAFGEREILIFLYHYTCLTSWFMQDGVRSHRITEDKNYFNELFDNRAIAHD